MGALGAFTLAGIGAASQRSAFAFGPSTVVLTPEETEGPYFVDEHLNRSDIRMDPADKSMQTGHPLNLTINVAQLKSGIVTPITGALSRILRSRATSRSYEPSRPRRKRPG